MTDQYAVLIRLPFPRGDFQDPPSVDWDAKKERALWDLISRPSKDGLDWNELSERFGVTLQFLQQQVAWLYERQLTQARAQMRKAPQQLQIHSNSPSPAPGSVAGSTALGGQPQRPPVAGSRGMFRQVSQQREALQPAPTDRRLSSTSTTTINRVRDTSRTDTPITDGREQGVGSSTRRPSVPRREQPQSTSFMRSPPLKEEDLSSSSEESDSEEETSPRRFPRWRNFGKYSEHQSRAGIRDDEDDDDDAPAFLPMPRHEQLPREHPSERVSQELSGTLRLDADQASAVWPPTQRRPVFLPTDAESSASSTGMSSASSTGPNHPARGDDRRAPLRSPRSGGRATEQSRASPRSKGGVNGSDGTPSMGSSFSDLDDTSVTQSALEEALMSNMQQGGMASRMSTISQALRSRYLQ
ncbi:hypothetical protein N7509_005174 [Penicillium cosmopolitanum]|uniref:Autophagy-related protein 29 n=1 Tax=Penicillium cosmopolitanum TaxID=1131564 RepID=A0A9W9W229_9EURO|nr:uncharacterized protein N7509_005174 [Penicillium cosmopolitanum]KAJ5397061.1 hypothetical protein N7509_005174 [Penicillium cosmopolitanum]